MELKLSYSKLSTFLFAFFLIIGLQNSLNAQIQVTNNTPCVIEVFIGQNDQTTLNPCDLCQANLPTAVMLNPGDVLDIYGQDICGEEAAWIAWRIPGNPVFGFSPNPGLINFCGYPNLLGPLCSTFFPTAATWNTSGTGYVSVTIN